MTPLLNYFFPPRDDLSLCTYCGKNHPTCEHICGVCRAIGKHAAYNHCSICKSLDHTFIVHPCRRQGCILITDHTHECEYCVGNHHTDKHLCEMYDCGQTGHSSIDHFQKVFCTKCEIVGHHVNQKHVECEKCNHILIDHAHQWCDVCKDCTIETHMGVCKFCRGCQIRYSLNCYGCTILRCIRCQRIEDDLDYDITRSVIRIPKKKEPIV